jgi:hypothetical protein
MVGAGMTMKQRPKRKCSIKAKKRGRVAEKRSLAKSKERPLFGFMAGKFDIVGDIESPLPDWKHWRPAKNL